jgi:hypothetical protein
MQPKLKPRYSDLNQLRGVGTHPPPKNKKVDKARLRELLRTGADVRTIADTLGCARDTVIRNCHNHDFPLPGSPGIQFLQDEPAPPPPPRPGSLEATGGRWADLAQYALKNSMTLMEAQQAWRNLRRPPEPIKRPK